MLFAGIKYTFSYYDGNDETFMPIPLPLQGASLLYLIFQCLVLFRNLPAE